MLLRRFAFQKIKVCNVYYTIEIITTQESAAREAGESDIIGAKVQTNVGPKLLSTHDSSATIIEDPEAVGRGGAVV